MNREKYIDVKKIMAQEKISEKLRELGVEEIKIVNYINNRGSFLHKLFFHLELEQFVVIFSNKE